jgi:hypothetical protein
MEEEEEDKRMRGKEGIVCCTFSVALFLGSVALGGCGLLCGFNPF